MEKQIELIEKVMKLGISPEAKLDLIDAIRLAGGKGDKTGAIDVLIAKFETCFKQLREIKLETAG